MDALRAVPAPRCERRRYHAAKPMGKPTMTIARSVIGMPMIDTAKAEIDVTRIVRPTENARTSGAESRNDVPTMRASVQYPVAKRATIATADREGLGGTAVRRIV